METANLFPDFKEFLRLLNSGNVKYLLIGGYAVNYYGHHRTTGDLDIWIAVDPENTKLVSRALQDFAFPADSVPPEMFEQPNKVFRFGRKPVRIELLTQPSGVEFSSCYERRTLADFDGLQVPVISLDDLKSNKRASGRRKDLDDLDNLP